MPKTHYFTTRMSFFSLIHYVGTSTSVESIHFNLLLYLFSDYFRPIVLIELLSNLKRGKNIILSCLPPKLKRQPQEQNNCFSSLHHHSHHHHHGITSTG